MTNFGNRMNKYLSTSVIVLFLYLIASTSSVKADSRRTDTKHTRVAYAQLDSLSFQRDTLIRHMVRGANGLIVIPPRNWQPFDYDVSFRDTVIYNPAYLPVVFTGNLLPKKLDFIKDKSPKEAEFHLISPDSTFAPSLKEIDRIQALRKSYFTSNPQLVRYNSKDFSAQKKTRNEEQTLIEKRNVFQDLITVEAPSEITKPGLEKVLPKRKYWVKTGEHSLQVAQNHISDNWYKGGNSSFLVRNAHRLNINYSKEKVKFDTVLEWKLNLQKTPADTVHDVNISEDLFRMYNVFGYRAFNKWSYSTTLETKTQLFHSYPQNSKDRRTSLLSPLYVNLGVGMSYNLEKSFKSDKFKKLKYSLNLSPLSLNLIYVGDKKVNETNFGIEEGKTTKTEYGSLINTELSFSFSRYLSWSSRLKYFTNYERVEGEFENKLDMALNRYFSTSLYLYLRYEDRKPADETWGKLQVNEMVSFGLNYKW